jgi:membrane protein YqaA with SNARE-associated domain
VTEPRPDRRRRLTILRLLALLAVIGITVFIFSIRDHAEQLAGYGYPGIFFLSILANATLILPAPGWAVTFAMGAVLHPLGVGIAAASGATLGELTGYMAGFSGQAVMENARVYERLLGWMRRYGGLTIIALAAIPNPFFDLAGIAAGVLRMPVGLFLLYTWIGKMIKMVLLAYGGAASIGWLEALAH